MLKLISSIFFVFLTICCNAQGSWDIGYLRVDTIGEKHIGRTVRLDFKSNNAWTNNDGSRGIRTYIGIKDTARIIIDTTSYILVERRKIYVDDGSYSDQYLECINCKSKVLIFDATILEVDNTSILFNLEVETVNNNQVTDKQVRTVRVDRSKLDGVMYRQ